MKNKICFFCAFLLNFPFFSQDIESSLYGIWEGKDRFVFFEENFQNQNNELVVVLKEYYGWYFDRAAENENYSKEFKRANNAATYHDVERINFSTKNISSKNIEAYEMEIVFSKFQKNKIPFCVIGDNIFLDFFIQDENNPNFYIGNVLTKGFTISEQKIDDEIECLYFINTQENKNSYVQIRYWITDMEFSLENVLFNLQNNEYFVKKHINSAGNIYSCVSGKSKKIRNVNKPIDFINEENKDFTFNNEKTILIKNKIPYLTKIADKKTFSDLVEIVNKQNSKRKPPAPPIFPPNDVNWYWDLIHLLEKDNQLIQQVRQRQRDFALQNSL